MLRPPTRTMSASYEALLYQNGFAIAGSADHGGLSVRDVLAENIHVESATVLDDCSVMSFRKEKVLIKRSEDMPIWSIGCSIQDGGHRPQCSRLMGTTRSRVNFFTNTFRPLGFFDYDNGLRVRPSFSRTRPPVLSREKTATCSVREKLQSANCSCVWHGYRSVWDLKAFCCTRNG